MSMFRIKYVLSFIVILAPMISFAQTDSLKTNIENLIGDAKGSIGVNIYGVENNYTLSINGDTKFPMQSVYKFPLALTILNQVDNGKLSLDQQIYLKKDDLRLNTWSPLREKYPNGNINITLNELLIYTVSESDNNGCDILFRILGGTEKVNQYIHDLGITNISIVATEEEMGKDWDVQYRNYSSPNAMGKLLYMFYNGKILSENSKDYLIKAMLNTKTGPGRIKGLLPKETIVAHKTGSSGTNAKGITAATNDVGIVTLPNGQHFIIVVFVSNSNAENKDRDEIIANIAKTVWDAYSLKK